MHKTNRRVPQASWMPNINQALPELLTRHWTHLRLRTPTWLAASARADTSFDNPVSWLLAKRVQPEPWRARYCGSCWSRWPVPGVIALQAQHSRGDEPGSHSPLPTPGTNQLWTRTAERMPAQTAKPGSQQY